MKLFAVSDLHLGTNEEKPMDIFGSVWDNHWEKISADWDSKVSDEDVVLIAGDISWSMTLQGAADDLNKIAERKGIKIIIRGNHDYWWSSIGKVRSILPDNFYALQNDSVKIGNMVFAGTRGWTVPEGKDASPEDKKLYARETGRLELSLESADKIRTDNDILIGLIHYPPFNARFDNSNFTDLFKKYRADIVVYGHLHGDTSRTRKMLNRDGVAYYLTSCDQLNNSLLEINI